MCVLHRKLAGESYLGWAISRCCLTSCSTAALQGTTAAYIILSTASNISCKGGCAWVKAGPQTHIQESADGQGSASLTWQSSSNPVHSQQAGRQALWCTRSGHGWGGPSPEHLLQGPVTDVAEPPSSSHARGAAANPQVPEVPATHMGGRDKACGS